MVSPNHIPVGHAHATVASLAWGIILPLGAILIRLVPSKKAWIIHAGVMLFGLALFTSGFGMGLWEIFDYKSTVDKLPHAIIGTTIFSLAWAQPLTGLGHHFQFRIERKRTVLSALHIFIGRVLIVLGIINGGLGFQVNEKDSTRTDRIIYGTLGGIVACCYLGASFWFEARRENQVVATRSGAGTPVVAQGETSEESDEEKAVVEKI